MEAENTKNESLREALFIQYVSALIYSGMAHIGKVSNPQTGKVERNLEAAQAVIELISMLKQKTINNLTPDEDKVISEGLANLQLNYVDELKKEDRKEAGPKA